MRMSRGILAAAAALSLTAAASPSFASIVVGDEVQLNYLYPETSVIYQTNSTAFTGPGTTIPIIYTGTATFDVNEIILTQDYNSDYASADFNGVKISDLTNPLAFTGWSVLSGTTTAPIAEYLSGGSIYVNWEGAPTTGVVLLGPSGVPEPAAWAMMLIGVAGLGAAIRARREQASVTA